MRLRRPSLDTPPLVVHKFDNHLMYSAESSTLPSPICHRLMAGAGSPCTTHSEGLQPDRAPARTACRLSGPSRTQVPATQVQDSVYHFGAGSDDWAEFVPVDELCCRRTVVAGQARDLFDGNAGR